MEHPLNNQNAAAPQSALDNVIAALNAIPEPDPAAPADVEEVEELKARFGELSTLLGNVDAHVEREYRNVLDNADDNTDAPETSDSAESSSQVDEAYAVRNRAARLLRNDDLTNAQKDELEEVIDELDGAITEATPLSFDPKAVVDDPLRI